MTSVRAVSRVAEAFRMTDETWRRHANPWSVWTRFAAIPLMIGSIWSRTWLGWWCLVPIVVVIIWLWLNPRAFHAVDTPTAWSSRGIYGERLWLTRGADVPASYGTVLRLLIVVGGVGFGLLSFGLVRLEIWPTLYGASLIVVAQLWRIDRMGLLYGELGGENVQAR
jgi:hypothetical protein